MAKKAEYVELTREESRERTYLVGLKWNRGYEEDFKRRWEQIPIFEVNVDATMPRPDTQGGQISILQSDTTPDTVETS